MKPHETKVKAKVKALHSPQPQHFYNNLKQFVRKNLVLKIMPRSNEDASASSPSFHTPRKTNDGSDRGPPSTIGRLLAAVSRLSLNQICQYTGIALVTTPLRMMSKMFENKIKSLQRQRDEAENIAKGQEVVTYNIMEQRDRLAKRNMQLELENEAANERLRCPNCQQFKKDKMYQYVSCGHRICLDCYHYRVGTNCPSCGTRAVPMRNRKILIKVY
jgi:hypothetical protein